MVHRFKYIHICKYILYKSSHKFTQTYTLYITIHIILHHNMVDNSPEKIKTSITCCAEVKQLC